MKETIRTEVKRSLQDSDILNAAKANEKSAVELLYNEITDNTDVYSPIETYMSEPQLRFDLNPFERWKAGANKYPPISELAKKHLTIAAISAMAERCFSRAGNIVTEKKGETIYFHKMLIL